jgi:hypothetical protein
MKENIISRTFQPLFGQPCWGLRHERMFNLSLNFGKPSLYIREPSNIKSKSEAVRQLHMRRLITVRGQWWLWIYCSYWRLSTKGKKFATGSSSQRKIEKVIKQLEGENLMSVEIESTTGATRFNFDLGGILECRRFERDTDDELWMLYKPNGYVLSVHGDGTFSHQLASAAEEKSQSLIKIIHSQRSPVIVLKPTGSRHVKGSP